MGKFKNIIAGFILAFATFPGTGQHTLQILPADESSAAEIRRLNYNAKPRDSLAAVKVLKRAVQYFYQKGYLTASIDSIVKDSSSTRAWIHTGSIYSTSSLRAGNADRLLLRQSGYREKFFTNKPYKPREISRLMENILKYCENNGYPFASVRLDSVEIGPDNHITASLDLQRNQKVYVDTMIVKGSSKLSRSFLRYYFNIKEGSPYNEQRIRRIESRIKDLPFVSEIRQTEVVFSGDKASIILYLDKKKASQFDGIIGIAPNEQTSGKLLITGDVKLKLLSVFNRGELIDLNWRKLEAQSQDLNFHFNYPFLFGTPFGFDYVLQLFKKDTSYLNLNNNLGFQVMFNGYNHIKAFYENQRSNLLSTQGLESATVLPEYADITTSFYGMGVAYSKLNYRYNPSRGYAIDMSGAIGSKNIRRNASVNPVLYDSIALKSTLYRVKFAGDIFIPLFRSGTFLVANKSGLLENKNLFDNELFRIGGLKTLRGFDEESITASAYSIFTLEFRYLFDVNSYFQLFFDGAYYERETNKGFISDTPYGFGLGVNFETRAGIFALSYALGSREGIPVQFKSAKIHFGITAKF